MTTYEIGRNIGALRAMQAQRRAANKFFYDGRCYKAAPQQDAPRVMAARFAGKCSSCDEAIAAGEQIRWWGATKTVAHADPFTCEYNRREREAREALAAEEAATPLADAAEALVAEEKARKARTGKQGEINEPVVGDGYYTIVLPGEGYRTLRVKTSKPGGFGEGQQILAYLSGSDNENSYTRCGFINGSEIHIWAKHRQNHTLLKAAHALINGGANDAAHAYVMASGRCWKCGKTLTTPGSIEAGIGPECAKKQ